MRKIQDLVTHVVISNGESIIALIICTKITVMCIICIKLFNCTIQQSEKVFVINYILNWHFVTAEVIFRGFATDV